VGPCHHQSHGAGDDPHAAHHHGRHLGRHLGRRHETDAKQTNDADDHHHHENEDDDHHHDADHHHDDAVHGRHQNLGAACARHLRHHAEDDVPDECHRFAPGTRDVEIDCCPKDADLDDALP
jgi:hypothetical protein